MDTNQDLNVGAPIEETPVVDTPVEETPAEVVEE